MPKRFSREKLREIIFEANTRAGTLYDIGLIVTVILSVLVVMLDSVQSVRSAHGALLSGFEWGFTFLFTVDYITRLFCVERRLKYTLSFFGLVDLLAVIPTYLGLFIPGSQYLAVIRFLRVFRIFHVLKLSSYQNESGLLVQALKASHRRISIFLFGVLNIVVILGALMYIVEGAANGFTSIPRAIYWAIVTLTTVGYGDISPQTGIGQAVAAVIMILGYSIIVIPTGIIASAMPPTGTTPLHNPCPSCGKAGHDPDAKHCKFCGQAL